MPDEADLGQAPGEGEDAGGGVVVGAVVDVDDLVGGEGLAGGDDRLGDEVDVLGLVLQRHDDGEPGQIGLRRHATSRLASPATAAFPMPRAAGAGHGRDIGRSERIRTSGPLLPKQVRYQAALHSDTGRVVTTEDAGVQGARRAEPEWPGRRQGLLATAIVLGSMPDGGRQAAVVGCASRRVEPERGQARSKARMLSAILQSLPAGVLATDAEGRIVFFNEGLVALLGRRPAIGAGWWEALPLSHPDGRPMRREESALARALAGGAPVRVSAMAARPDGRQVQLGSLAAPVRDGDGRLTGAVEVMLEADELRGPERTAADLDQARLAAIIASSDDAIISKTLDGVVTSWNAGATRIFGYEPEEMIGQSIIRIIPPELGAEEEAILSRLRRGERVDHFDTERIGKDGRRVFDLAHHLAGAQQRRRGGGSLEGRPRRHRAEARRGDCSSCSWASSTTGSRTRSPSSRPSPGSRCGWSRTRAPSWRASPAGCRPWRAPTTSCVHGEMQRAELADLVREQVDLGAHDRRIRWTGPRVVLELAHRAAAGAGAARARDERAQVRRAIDAGGAARPRLGADADRCRGDELRARVAGDRRWRHRGAGVAGVSARS